MRCRRCDHQRLFHQHHHPRTHCSQCACPKYVAWWRLRVPAVLGEHPRSGQPMRLDVVDIEALAADPEVDGMGRSGREGG